MQRLIFANDRVIHSIKTAFAVLIGFALTNSMHFQVNQWLIVSIVVVMCAQMNVGSILQKSYMRFLGTFFGSIIAIVTLHYFGSDPVPAAFAIGISAFIFSFISTSQASFNEAGTLGAVTVAISLIGQDPTITTALERFFEISIGILIAALVSQFLLPIHARRHLRDNQARTLRLLRKYYLATLFIDKNLEETKSFETLDEDIVKALITQRKLATEAAREHLSRAYDLKLFKKSLGCEKEILRSITFMHSAFQASTSVKNLLSTLPAVEDFHERTCTALTLISKRLSAGLSGDAVTIPDIKNLKAEVISRSVELDPNELIYTNGFLFCAEMLSTHLQALEQLTRRTSLALQNDKKSNQGRVQV